VNLDAETLVALHEARTEEKRQALYYRSLAARAEEAGNADEAERLNGLVADEQHHLSRLSARLLELNERLVDLSAEVATIPAAGAWEDASRDREQAEIDRYERLLARPLDDHTAAMIRDFLEAERRHREVLGGKWMRA
jgi:rubrerythrin